MADKLQAPTSKDLQGRIIDGEHERASKKLDRGVMGALFGFGAEKPGNIAGFTLIVSFIIFGLVIALYTETPNLSKKDLLLIVGGFISLTLGFVFGRSTS